MAYSSFLYPEYIQDTPRLFTAIAEWLAVFVFAFMYQTKKEGIRLCVAASGAFFMITGLQFVAGLLPIGFWIPSMMMAVLLMYVFMYSVLDILPLDCGMLVIHSFVLAEFAASLYQQIYVWYTAVRGESFAVSCIIMVVIYAIVYPIYYYVFRGDVPKDRPLYANLRDVMGALLTGIGAFIMSNLSFVWSGTPFSATSNLLYVRTLVDFGGMLMLITQQGHRNELLIRGENEAIDQLFRKQYDQYKLAADNSELLRREMHDLKHYLLAIRSESDPAKKEEYLADMEQAIAVQESFMDTGNQVLDVILTTKSLQCQKSGITFHVMVDAGYLKNMHVKDICALFGNLLDNAMEAALQAADDSKRIITLNVRKKNQFLIIECENYSDQELRLKENAHLPDTTKKDALHHGYGLKSILNVAEKYGGSLSITQKEGWVKTKVLILMKET